MKLKKCLKCAGDVFVVQETILHTVAFCSKEKSLTVYKEQSGGIDSIICKKCNANYLEKDFERINFK